MAALARVLWAEVFAGDAATAAAWRESCACGGPAATPRCPAPLSSAEAEAASASAAAAAAAALLNSATGGAAAPPLPPPLLLLPYPAVPSRSWVALGFQGADPRTDLRALGASGLAFLARLLAAPSSALAAEGPNYRDRVLALAVGCARGVELPLAIAALNAQYMLMCHLHLFASAPAMCCCCGARIRELEYGARASQSFRGASLGGFVRLLGAEGPDAFFHLYAITVLLLAREWRAASGGGEGAAAGRAAGAARAGAGAGAGSAAQALAAGSRLRCFDAEDGGTRVGDARLLLFPEMLRSVRERVLGALAGIIDEDDVTDEASEAPEASLSPATRQRRRRRSRSVAPLGIAGLTDVLLAE